MGSREAGFWRHFIGKTGPAGRETEAFMEDSLPEAFLEIL